MKTMRFLLYRACEKTASAFMTFVFATDCRIPGSYRLACRWLGAVCDYGEGHAFLIANPAHSGLGDTAEPRLINNPAYYA